MPPIRTPREREVTERARARRAPARALTVAALAVASLAAVALARPALEAASALAEAALGRVTRDESVRVRIDAERGLRVDLARAPGTDATPRATARDELSGASADAPGWLVLGRGAPRDGADRESGALPFVGAAMGAAAHVAITPPFVVLTRGRESLLLRVGAGGVDAERPLPRWVRGEPGGALIARFGMLGVAEIDAGSVRLRRRFVGL